MKARVKRLQSDSENLSQTPKKTLCDPIFGSSLRRNLNSGTKVCAWRGSSNCKGSVKLPERNYPRNRRQAATAMMMRRASRRKMPLALCYPADMAAENGANICEHPISIFKLCSATGIDSFNSARSQQSDLG